MIREYDLEKLQALSGLLAAGLWDEPLGESDRHLPQEVYRAFKEAQIQMNDLPQTIAGLTKALERFHTLEQALNRMKALAGAAMEWPGEPARDGGRQALDREFASLAALVALEAGQAFHQGPKLRLTSPAQARSALMIISYLDPVLETMSTRLNEQKELIIAAFNETLNFLEIVAHSYPEAPCAQRLPELLKRIKAGSDSRVRPSSNPGIRFH